MASRKRISLFILLLALVVPILAACGGGGGTATSPTAATGGGAAATSAPAAPEATAATGGAATAAPEATAATGGAATAMPEATAAAGGEATGTAGATAGGSGDVTKIQGEDGATLRVASWGDESEQKVNQDSFARFNKVFPNIKIQYTPVPKDYQTAMKADAAGGTLADVFYLDSSLMTAFAPNGVLLPLDDAMQQAGVKADDYIGDLVKLYQADGKTYALPKDQGALALFVNNDMAQKAGVDPASLKTWDDLTAAAKKLTAGEGPGKTFGVCVDPDVQRVSAFLLQNNNPIIQDKKAVFNQDNGIKAVEWWYGFKKDGTGEFPKNQGADWCGDAFSKKKSAIVVEGGWLLPFMAKQAPDIKYTAMPIPLPAGGKQATLVFTNGWAASANSKYPKAAAALALFLTSAANQQPILQTGFALPTIKSLLNDPYFQTHPNDKVLADAPSYGSVADLVFGGPAKKEDVIKTLKEQAFDPIFTTGADVKTSLDNAANAVDQTLSAS